jgi:N-carbamoylputrescine amidase
MKLAVGQFDVRIGDVEANLEAVGRLAEQASAQGADLLVLPEMATAGYAFRDRDEMAPFAEPADGSGAGLRGWSDLASRHGMFIAGGFPERSGDDHFNSAALVGPGGVVGIYRKVHLFFNEKDLFRPGDMGWPVFDLPFGRVGLQVCYDTFFPEAGRSLALNGAELICTPGNFVRNFRRRVYNEQGLTQAGVASMGIASQNQVYVALAARTGEEREIGFIGASLIVGWDGWPLAGPASRDREELLVAELDLAEATAKKQRNPRNHALGDRRPETYVTRDASAPAMTS